ncbi:XRE family transcriptional regulator [Mesorhizobium sp. M0751]|uniref:helix-turn-helix domain-containing protein n=1 Tax=unclassified Mesorhizobium TaxID=325217 RepID=UPI00333BADD8
MDRITGSATRTADPAVGDLGVRVKALRLAKRWTLEEASARTGLSRSSISKIEREEMSPTFDALQKLARGFQIKLGQLIGESNGGAPTGSRHVIRHNDGKMHAMTHYLLRLLTGELKKSNLNVIELEFKATDFSEFPDWERHDTEDFMYVLAGQVEFHSELYAPVILGVGDSIQYDARMGHAFVRAGNEAAKALWISLPV